MSGGSCHEISMGQGEYTVSGINDTFTCDTSTNCETDSCIIDMTYAISIANHVISNPTWTMIDSDNCKLDDVKPTVQNGNLGAGVANVRVCEGTVPDLRIVRL